jgi:hypothetical protein
LCCVISNGRQLSPAQGGGCCVISNGQQLSPAQGGGCWIWSFTMFRQECCRLIDVKAAHVMTAIIDSNSRPTDSYKWRYY